jgi:hypothetical protein
MNDVAHASQAMEGFCGGGDVRLGDCESVRDLVVGGFSVGFDSAGGPAINMLAISSGKGAGAKQAFSGFPSHFSSDS